MNNKLTDKQVRETIDALSSVPTSKVNGVSFGDIAAALHDLQERGKADSNNHPAHGPVSLDRLHQIRETLSKAAAQSDGGNVGYAMSDAVKAIDELLEVRNAEPAGYHVIKECGKVGCSVTTLEEAEKTREFWNEKWTIKPYFYTAMPAPVADGWLVDAKRLAELHGTSFVVFRHGDEPQCADPTEVVISLTDKG